MQQNNDRGLKIFGMIIGYVFLAALAMGAFGLLALVIKLVIGIF